MKIERRYSLEAAHYLPRTHRNHKCNRMHGHNWEVTLTFQGPVDKTMGWVVDFARVDDLWTGAIHTQCDHRLLNEVNGLDNPTSENLAVWIWQRLNMRIDMLPAGEWSPRAKLIRVVVAENADCSAIYEGGE